MKICVNSYNIIDEDMANAGQGIYLAASIVDHSCVPNAVATFEGTQLSITLTQDLEGTGPVNWSRVRMINQIYIKIITFSNKLRFSFRTLM